MAVADATVKAAAAPLKLTAVAPLKFAPLIVTRIGPEVAAAGTVACMAVDDVTVNGAAVPLNVTEDAFVRFVPLIATLVPAGPLDGVKLVTVGTAGAPLRNALKRFAIIC